MERYNEVVPHTHRNAAPVLAKNVPTSVVQVNGHNHTFHLTTPINLDAHWDSDRFVIDYRPLGISVYERDEPAAYAAFAEMFETVWETIAESPDRELTGDAQDLKRHFRGMVKRLAPPSDE